jgi:hypothetical protein
MPEPKVQLEAQRQRDLFSKMTNEIDGIKTDYKNYFESATSNYKKEVKVDMPLNVQSAVAKSMKGTDEYMVQTFGVSPNGYKAQMEEKKKQYSEGVINPSDNFFGDSYIKYIFDIITTVIPSSVIEDFVTVQGMEKAYGEVWYMDIIKGTNKAPSASGDYYIGADGTLNTDYHYTDENVTGEVVFAQTGTALTTGHVILSQFPIRSSASFTVSYTIGGTKYTATANTTTGAITGTFIDTGSVINFATGDLIVNFTGGNPPDNPSSVTATYQCVSTKTADTVSVEVKLRSALITAKRRALNTRWIVDSAVILQKDFGKNIEQVLLDQVIAGVMHEIANEVMWDVYNNAMPNTANAYDFSKTPPSQEIPYIVHRAEILGLFNSMSLAVEKKVKKVKPNFVFGGYDLMDVLGGLPKDKYEPVDYGSTPPVGVHVAGNTGRFKVIQNLDFTDNLFTVGAKIQDNWLLTGYVLAWYIPMMVTDIFHTRNLGVERDMFTWYGTKVVNGNFYQNGQIND